MGRAEKRAITAQGGTSTSHHPVGLQQHLMLPGVLVSLAVLRAGHGGTEVAAVGGATGPGL